MDTPLMTIWLITLIIITVIYLLVSERMPLDLTAMGILAFLMLSGILTPKEALAGFANSSVITIGSLFILSRALMRTGALGLVSDRMIRYSQGNERRILLMAMIGTALPSAFMNNTPIVVLFVTIIMSVCCTYGLSPSKYLLPVSYSSIVGGLCTLIGTSTNLIVSDLSFRYGYGALGMFELAPLGLPIAILVITLLYLTAPRLMPNHKAPVCEIGDKDAPHYLSEFIVPKGSRIIGSEPFSFLTERYRSIELFELIRGNVIHFPEREGLTVQEGDLLLVKGSASDLVALLNKKIVSLPYKIRDLEFKTHSDKSLIVELIIPPQSSLLGEQPIRSRLQHQMGIQVIAVKRRGMHYSEQKIGELRLRTGDILLVQCTRDGLDEIRNRPDFIIVEEIHHKIIARRRAPLALSIFLAMIAAASTGIADITACALTAAFIMILTGCIHLRDAYRSVDVQILLLIVGTLALGNAMDKTGAAQVYAELFLAPLNGESPQVVLAAIILLTCILTELMSNSATAVLLLPIAISTALSIGVNPKPFIVGVCIGASCGFAIPIGYQTHLLVYGPGGYRFSDFLKMGIPLDLITCLLSSLIIPHLWPF